MTDVKAAASTELARVRSDCLRLLPTAYGPFSIAASCLLAPAFAPLLYRPLTPLALRSPATLRRSPARPGGLVLPDLDRRRLRLRGRVRRRRSVRRLLPG